MKSTYMCFSVVLRIVLAEFIEDSFPKCCSMEQNMIIHDKFSYTCGLDAFTNIKIINNDIIRNVSGNYCVEVLSGHVFVFQRIGNNEFKKIFFISPALYPKCCPLGYRYNTLLHSCEEKVSIARNFGSFRFVRIGLRDCKIIIDYKQQDDIAKDLLNVPGEDYCIDNTEDNLEVLRVCTNDFGVCQATKCIHKCCPDGHSFVNGSHCIPTYVYGVDLNISESIDQSDDFVIIHGYTGKIYLQPLHWEFHLDSKGVFRLFDEKIGKGIYGPSEETYCIEHATKNGISFGHRLFRKYPERNTILIDDKYIINGYVMIVSSIFLLLTILVYTCTGEIKKLFGKTLVSFCICLVLMLSILIYSTFKQEELKEDIRLCYSFGFLLLYGEFSTFLWLKLLCFDIYYTFGSGRIRKSEQSIKRFLLYSVYGWGLSLVLTSIPLILFFVNILPEPVQIAMGNTRCAIERENGNYADLLFRTIPVTIIQIINVFLFFKTVKCCIDVKNGIRRINDNPDSTKKYLANKERFILVAKLCVIMGFGHVFEVVTSFYDFNQTRPTKYLEIVWDIINCSQGVFIFIIFICKKKVVEKIKLLARVQKLRKISLSSAATLTTHLSFYKDKKKNTAA